jgi:hypothetical protein
MFQDFKELLSIFSVQKVKYLEQFPQVELTLLDRPQAKVVGLVRDGEVDFGLALESIMTKRLREQGSIG